ncbi:MAG TPA: tetratricopeptide repeat protein [Flavisolibacter sp.]|jgi:tetratricopeptide (TPR) repeat protein|nr:tetratricopeptide repeat protein [Flavisolibacter sp.]
MNRLYYFSIALCSLQSLVSCNEKKEAPAPALIEGLSLKRGSLIACGAPEGKFGTVQFETSCGAEVKGDFNLAVDLLHSFEYDEAEKVFARIIDKEPSCAMAYWGVAMSNFHALWTPPNEAELKKGSKAIALARSIKSKTKREAAYIDAIAAYYTGWETTDHKTRALRFEKAMEQLYRNYPNDKEAAVFYALALDAAADPTDKTFARQQKAGRILNGLYPGEPDHPGIIHYLIHTYDAPELAEQALPAARKYASVAPSSSHALHMPSHIFTRLGLWKECLQSNEVSVSAAQCYATAAGIDGHWDEELHSLDYLVYAHLQRGDNKKALEQLKYTEAISKVTPTNFKVAYAFAAIPSRYVLENKQWKEASGLPLHAGIDWKAYPWQEAIVHFTRLLGFAHLKDSKGAQSEWKTLQDLQAKLVQQKDAYKANQVGIQLKSGEAWIAWASGRQQEAVQQMQEAMEMEDHTEKHPVTPCEVVPAAELYADLLMEVGQSGQALQAYEADLKKHPNRFNGLLGAGRAAEKTGNKDLATSYYRQLLSIVTTDSTDRPEMVQVRAYVKGG